ncbi:TraR/DksA C4-type zinc finger protein [Streptomyces sp. NPDC053542]|uniref:TraR/DksA C4-type zinc finger protein n=1 Tax=Streptomyces sp. NPDC053542 TaxID=3365710 RepID=UPI0037D1A830
MVAKETAAHDSTAAHGRGTPPDGAAAGDPATDPVPDPVPGRPDEAARAGGAPLGDAGGAGQAAAKKPARKKTAKKSAAKKTATGNAPVGEDAPEDAAAQEAATGHPPAEADDTGTDSTATGNPPPKESAPRKTTGKKAAARKAPAKRASTASKAAPPEEAVPAKKTGAKTVVAKKTPGGAPAAAVDDSEQTAAATALPKARTGPATAAELPVRPGEDPWSEAEADEARSMLREEEHRLREEIRSSEDAIAGLMRDSSDSTGDEADTGSKNITREHEMALASNAREMLLQTERALERLDAGTYGLCENCGKPIGKARMQAFPRATLCVECKQKTERR